MITQKFPSLDTELQSLAEGILKRVEKHDGEWSWYQLDRSLSYDENLSVIHRLMEAINNVETNGLIRADSSGSEANPVYWITEKGKQILKKS